MREAASSLPQLFGSLKLIDILGSFGATSRRHPENDDDDGPDHAVSTKAGAPVRVTALRTSSTTGITRAVFTW